MKQHKWHKEIKAWADGKTIQEQWDYEDWKDVKEPEWDKDISFRIKPQPTISYKETIIDRLRNDDEFWNEVFGAYDKQCDKQEPQPEEFVFICKSCGDKLGIVYEPKEWQGLSDEEIISLIYKYIAQDCTCHPNEFIEAIQQKLKEKNT